MHQTSSITLCCRGNRLLEEKLRSSQAENVRLQQTHRVLSELAAQVTDLQAAWAAAAGASSPEQLAQQLADQRQSLAELASTKGEGRSCVAAVFLSSANAHNYCTHPVQ